MKRLSLGVTLFVASTLLASAQTPSGPSTPADRLAFCQSLLRVKQDMPCRCDQAEQLAAQILLRAEKAEEEVTHLKQQLQAKEAPKPAESPPPANIQQ